MIKPPYTKWINDIKTKLGFNRTMTASGEDVVDAVNKQADEITDLGPYNGLDSDSIVAALSAAQGKALKTLLDKLNSYELLVDYIDTYGTRRYIYRMGNVITAVLRNINQTTEIPSGSLAISYVIPEKYRPKTDLVQMGMSQKGTIFNFGISTSGGVNGWLYASGTPGQMFVTITWSVPLSSL